ncbi:2-oxoacid:acceptor oxidoreductase subunit alpha [Thermococcus sp. GR7]|uniref:2-oxoacid:acceptor oxidoreductase subunit alpha n=1 Tax=unclassified Thermococcus TaxID=2627626 RepID=UPI0014322908|nr:MULTISPECIES: 2-oxoacid:acceptor oxidoreductase subunit alpha [unclassified Thermococcus]NJE46569.1 2-oxoacid:acceptor oxidoreductase subunit alpha [Thermococcus sp. GR7]NJE79078.1 2-oxoacid:acceptor oxidoreductase subunit alpha [Thermococcus sp. GR4]NJF23600.1 2-oxoacid:acceptor oxidoreductase subunit alpha [Thermococcus sp. GR5]
MIIRGDEPEQLRLLKRLYKPGNYFLQGNEAVAYGALFAGCRFYAGYPITPSSEIAETMARELPKLGGYYLQMEDEIGSIAAMVGASWTGFKVMTATAGPGFSLMQENLGYAVMTETPLVLVDVQRSGPSTGQATKGAQGDFFQARWGTHGDHPIVAVSPISVEDAFWETVRAFNISEKLRTPVVVLFDGVLAHTREQIKIPDVEEIEITYRKLPKNEEEAKLPFGDPHGDGVPPMPLFGHGYFTHVTGSTHKENGLRDVYTPEVHDRLVRRIHRKIEQNKHVYEKYEEYFTDDAEILVVSWGVTARPSLGAVLKAREEGTRVGLFVPKTVHPFPGKRIKELGKKVRAILVPEMNLGQLILEVQRFVYDDVLLKGVNKIGGVPLTVEEILREIRGVA